MKSIIDIITQLFCNHESQECITNFSDDSLIANNPKHRYRSAWRCRKCNKLIYHEELDPNCNVVNWQAKGK